jgi:coiled-coil domain-containing protein 6
VLVQLRNEKAELAHTLQQEQESLVNKLMRRIQKLESETNTKQAVPIDSSSLLLQ